MTIAKMIMALFVIALLTGLCCALYSMDKIVACIVGLFCALGWAVNILENKE
ncbi:MAG: hypothetical protein PHW03_02815 [Eubacteriales bacterium]|nr:hypothetical protein [Eubacteriales bacterium]